MYSKDSTHLIFLDSVLAEIEAKDKLHSKKVKSNVNLLQEKYPREFAELCFMIKKYFDQTNVNATEAANSYLRMVNDMRREGIYFLKHNSYRCKNQEEAFKLVYSQADVMDYYMKALLLSQVLWTHHFKMFIYFRDQLIKVRSSDKPLRILDVGPGHGFFSYMVQQAYPDFSKIDLVDISEGSIAMTRKIIGVSKGIEYHIADIYDFNSPDQYDLIILGEVLEHLDEPSIILKKLAQLLSDTGILWFTTPTNSPAIDHVYLFKTKEDIFDLVRDSGLIVAETNHYFAEEVNEDVALKNRITNLVGVFAKNNN